MPVKGMSQGKHEMADGFAWVILLAGHSERHAAQIREVAADPGFPK